MGHDGVRMATLTIAKGGKLSLPKELLDHLGTTPGESIEVTQLPGGQLEFRAASQNDAPNDTVLGPRKPRASRQA